jgi:hypothetical protein
MRNQQPVNASCCAARVGFWHGAPVRCTAASPSGNSVTFTVPKCLEDRGKMTQSGHLAPTVVGSDAVRRLYLQSLLAAFALVRCANLGYRRRCPPPLAANVGERIRRQSFRA